MATFRDCLYYVCARLPGRGWGTLAATIAIGNKFNYNSPSLVEVNCSYSLRWIPMQARNSRIGLILFFIYLLLYGGFVFLIALRPDSMDLQPIAGINLAIVYGFVLIVGAFLMAVLYGLLCKTDPPSEQGVEDEQ